MTGRATQPGRLVRLPGPGHPPPLLIGPDGAARLLDTRPDLLLGVGLDTARHNHAADLPAGATVLFYTDGLVERRGVSIDDGLAWLADAAAERSRLPLDELRDHLVDRTAEHASDDIALLAVRVR